MRFNKGYLILLFFIFTISIGIVCAEDNDTSYKSFTELNDEINKNSEITLDGYYIYKEDDTQFRNGINLRSNIVIDGQNKTTIDGANKARIFTSSDPISNVTVKGITFLNAYTDSDSGSAIGFKDSSDITINARFVNNHANDGGAVYMGYTSNSSIAGEFENNSGRYGGAVYFSRLQNCQIYGTYVNNTATGDGAAVYVSGESKSVFINGTFISNSGFNGGAVYLNDLSDSNVISLFSNNRAQNRGALIYIMKSKNLSVSGQFKDNHASNEGSIYASDSNNLTIKDALFNDNSPVVINADNSEITGCVFNSSDLNIDGNNFTLSDSNLTNTAISLEDINLHDINFTSCELTFMDSNISDCNFNDNVIVSDGASFKDCNFTYNNITLSGDVAGSNFKGDNVTLTGGNFSGNTFSDGDVNITGEGINFISSELQNTSVFIEGEGLNIASVVFTDSPEAVINVTAGNISDCEFINPSSPPVINLNNSTLGDIEFKDCDLILNLGECEFLPDSSLVLKDSEIINSTFSGDVSLSGDNVNITASHFEDANLLSNTTDLAFKNCEFTDAFVDLSGSAALLESNFTDSNLTGTADVSDSEFIRCKVNLTDADIDDSQFINSSASIKGKITDSEFKNGNLTLNESSLSDSLLDNVSLKSYDSNLTDVSADSSSLDITSGSLDRCNLTDNMINSDNVSFKDCNFTSDNITGSCDISESEFVSTLLDIADSKISDSHFVDDAVINASDLEIINSTFSADVSLNGENLNITGSSFKNGNVSSDAENTTFKNCEFTDENLNITSDAAFYSSNFTQSDLVNSADILIADSRFNSTSLNLTGGDIENSYFIDSAIDASDSDLSGLEVVSSSISLNSTNISKSDFTDNVINACNSTFKDCNFTDNNISGSINIAGSVFKGDNLNLTAANITESEFYNGDLTLTGERFEFRDSILENTAVSVNGSDVNITSVSFNDSPALTLNLTSSVISDCDFNSTSNLTLYDSVISDSGFFDDVSLNGEDITVNASDFTSGNLISNADNIIFTGCEFSDESVNLTGKSEVQTSRFSDSSLYLESDSSNVSDSEFINSSLVSASNGADIDKCNFTSGNVNLNADNQTISDCTFKDSNLTSSGKYETVKDSVFTDSGLKLEGESADINGCDFYSSMCDLNATSSSLAESEFTNSTLKLISDNNTVSSSIFKDNSTLNITGGGNKVSDSEFSNNSLCIEIAGNNNNLTNLTFQKNNPPVIVIGIDSQNTTVSNVTSDSEDVVRYATKLEIEVLKHFYYRDIITVTVRVTSNPNIKLNGYFTLKIGNYTADAGLNGNTGVFYIDSRNLDLGIYIVEVSYINDTECVSSTVSDAFEIHAQVSIKAPATTRGYGSSYDFIATFYDNYGNPLKNTNVQFTVDGKTYTVKTDSRGVAKLKSGLSSGTHAVLVKNPVTGYEIYSKAKIVSRVQLKTPSLYYSSKSFFKVRIYGDDGKPVGAKEKVTFTFRGKKYTAVTDKNGYAKFRAALKNVPSKIYKIKVTYKKFRYYKYLTIKHSIRTSRLIQSDNKKVTVKVQLKSNKILKNKKISVCFLGKYYKIKSNSKGNAYFKISKNTIKRLSDERIYYIKMTYLKDVVYVKMKKIVRLV